MGTMNNLNDSVIDLKEILTVLRKRYIIILLITLCAIAAGGIYSYFIVVPLYKADTVLLVTQVASEIQKSQEAGMAGLVNSIAKLPERTLNTYLAQLKSEAVMERVIQKLKLDKAGYTARGLSGLMRLDADEGTNQIKLTVTHTNPYLTAKIANTTVQEFQDYVSEANEQQITKSLDLLKKQAAATGEELKRAVAQLNSLESQPRDVTMLSKLIAVKTEDLSKYQSLSLQAGMEYQQLLAGIKQIEQQLKDTPPVLETSEFDERLGKSVMLEEVNPAYTQLKTMANEKAVMAAEKGVQVTNVQVINNQLTAELKALQAELGQKKSLLQEAQNEANRLEETNSLLRTKIDETNITRSMTFGDTNFVVMSPAITPGGPIQPDKVKNMVVAFMMGLVVSIGLAFTLNYFDNTVKTPKDIEEIFGIPVLGQIPVYNPGKLDAIGGNRLWITTR